MANTYTQLYAQIIFSPQGRHNLLTNRIKIPVYKYITGIVQNKKQKLMIKNGIPDHNLNSSRSGSRSSSRRSRSYNHTDIRSYPKLIKLHSIFLQVQ